MKNINQNRFVCLCNQVTLSEIKKSLRAGALTTAEVQQFTSAGTSCGRCKKEIDAIVEQHKMQAGQDQQLRINFE